MLVRTAVVKQVQGISLAGKTDSNYWIVMDGPKEFGGSDVTSILQKKRVALDNRIEPVRVPRPAA